LKLLGKLFIYIFFTCNLLAQSNPPKLSIKEALPLLSKIKQYALHVGNGASEIYVFVDPLCPHSKDFLDLIVTSDKMQSRYSYYIFLYELDRFHSASLINNIYNCSDTMQCLKKVMLTNHTFEQDATAVAEITQKINKIEEIAKKLNVYKRPYLIINKAKKRGE